DSSEQLSIFDIKAQAGEPKGKKLIGNIFDFLELFVFTLAVVVLLLSFFFRHSVVDGDSMLGTLHNGEHLIISDLFYSPSRGDIVVFEDHSTGFKKPLIKRIIGVGGDEIRISGKKVYLNGELLEEDYVYVDGYQNDASIVLVVPEGELFVMGDHRNESSDSRMFGTIPEDAIIGRVVLRFYPFDKFGAVD
ncbi:MAG: signal peptidase I, partial [Clostridia bacterium]|nr:signal peptidase I [Clostridia bacterium]